MVAKLATCATIGTAEVKTFLKEQRAEVRQAKGLSMSVGVASPSKGSIMNYLGLVATGADIEATKCAVALSDARDIANRSYLATVSFAMSIAYAHCTPDPSGKFKADEESCKLAKMVSEANDNVPVRLASPEFTTKYCHRRRLAFGYLSISKLGLNADSLKSCITTSAMLARVAGWSGNPYHCGCPEPGLDIDVTSRLPNTSMYS